MPSRNIFLDTNVLMNLAKAGAQSSLGALFLSNLVSKSSGTFFITTTVEREVYDNLDWQARNVFSKWFAENYEKNFHSVFSSLPPGGDNGERSIIQAVEGGVPSAERTTIYSSDTRYPWGEHAGAVKDTVTAFSDAFLSGNISFVEYQAGLNQLEQVVPRQELYNSDGTPRTIQPNSTYYSIDTGLEIRVGSVGELTIIDAKGNVTVVKPTEKFEVEDDGSVKIVQHCFTAETLIQFPGGASKPIADVVVGDMVLAFDEQSGMPAFLARPVARTFAKESEDVVSLHGVRVTAGHLFLTADGAFRQIGQILADDGVIVREDSVVIRARTNQPVNSEEDCAIPVGFSLYSSKHVVKMRAGTPFGRLMAEGPTYVLSARMAHDGYFLRDDGLFENAAGEIRMADWPWGDPREHPIARDYVVGEPWEIASAPTQVVN